MVTIKKQEKNDQEYFYLEHSYRDEGKVKKIQKYLGKKIPKNIGEIEKEFKLEVYDKVWLGKIDKIKTAFSKEKERMPDSAKEKEKETFATKFTYDTQRIEGSTLNLRETANLLEKGITPAEKPLRDVKEAEAHKKVFYEMLDYKKDLSLQICLYWHKLLFEETKEDIAGKIRNHHVAISQSKFEPPMPSELDFLLKEFFEWYNKNKKKLHPVLLAGLVHLKFVTIHPFSDGNGRVSRLMMNFILNKHKFPMLNIEYKNRNSYYRALERAQTEDNEHLFIRWFFKEYIKKNKKYL